MKCYPLAIGRIPSPGYLVGWGIRSFPPARLGLRHVWRLERHALRFVGLEPQDLDGTPAPEAPGMEPGPPRDPLSAEMDRLLARSIDQSTARGREELFGALLHQLVPDEARIIAALADGHVSPLIDVHDRSVRGAAGTSRLENASLVGRTAAVALPRSTPVYVGHLRSLGLLEIGPEDPSLAEDYEVLMAEELVRQAIANAGGLLPPRIVRRTLRLSELGRELWEAVRPIESRADASP